MSRTASVVAQVVRGAFVFIGFAPFIVPLVAGVPVLGNVGALLERWFVFQCHREANRSLVALGMALPVCVRCLGIYVGLGLGALTMRPVLSPVALRIWVGVAALIMILDVATENLGMRAEWAPLRLVTGLLLAYPVGAAVVRAIDGSGEPEEIADQP